MSQPPKKSAAAQFGLPKVQTGSGYSTPKLVYPLIPGFDQAKSEIYWRQTGKILFQENVATLIQMGYIDLDKAYLESKNEKVVTLRKTMTEACKAPYCKHKLWSGLLKLYNGQLSYAQLSSTGSMQSFIGIIPYQYEKTLPEELTKILADLSSMPDADNTAEIAAATTKYFEPFQKGDKPYITMDCKIYYEPSAEEGQKETVGNRIAKIITELNPEAAKQILTQDDVVQCFIGGDFTSKPYTDKKTNLLNPGWNLNVDDVWFFRPV